MDDVNNYLYYTDPLMGNIVRIQYDPNSGENVKTAIILEGLSTPYGIDIDVYKQ